MNWPILRRAPNMETSWAGVSVIKASQVAQISLAEPALLMIHKRREPHMMQSQVCDFPVFAFDKLKAFERNLTATHFSTSQQVNVRSGRWLGLAVEIAGKLILR